jgi:hypothetical protein
MLANSRSGMDVMPRREVLRGIKFRSTQHVAIATYVILVHSVTRYLTPRSSVLLEKPPVAQLLKNFPTLYET